MQKILCGQVNTSSLDLIPPFLLKEKVLLLKKKKKKKKGYPCVPIKSNKNKDKRK